MTYRPTDEVNSILCTNGYKNRHTKNKPPILQLRKSHFPHSVTDLLTDKVIYRVASLLRIGFNLFLVL